MRKIIGGQIGYDNIIYKKFNILKNQQILANGRSALYFILKNIENKISTVYVPNYLCESILQPIRELGIKYKFYKIKKEFNFKLPFKNNSAVIFLNYFGRDTKKYQHLKNDYKKNIYYIKDCTHDVFNKSNNFKEFQKNNIFKFASIKKYIPFPIGAITNTQNIKLDSTDKKKNVILYNFANLLKTRGKYFSIPKKNIDIVLEKKMLKSQANYKLFESKKIFTNKVPIIIKNKLLKYNLKKILNKRNNNFLYLKKKLSKKIKVVSINKNFPLNFTIMLRKKQKDKLVSTLGNYRIFATTLWPLPNEINLKKNRYSHTLSSRLLSLPIDHRYNKKDIDFMLSIIHKTLKL